LAAGVSPAILEIVRSRERLAPQNNCHSGSRQGFGAGTGMTILFGGGGGRIR
jgi:hypothetical protein